MYNIYEGYLYTAVSIYIKRKVLNTYSAQFKYQ